MCKSAIEGGQRCPSGARTRFDSAQAKFEAVCAADDPTSADVDTARQGWEDAASDYASTDEGRAYLAQIAD